MAIADKERVNHEEKARIIDVIGHVEGKNAIIVDDFSISGGTLIELAHNLKTRGVKRIFACLSHTLLNEVGVKKLEESPIELLITTDSVNNPHIKSSSKIKIISVAPLFAETIARIDRRESVSPLFEEVPKKVLDNM